RHQVKLLPIDTNKSGWMCRREDGGVRLGLRFVRGLPATAGQAIEAAQPFTSPDDLARRCRLRDDQLTKLADAGALAAFGMTRREAMWQAARAARDAGELFTATSALRPRRAGEKVPQAAEGDSHRDGHDPS